MAYAPHRSAIDELNQGMIDGKYKQIAMNRGGQIDPCTHAARADLMGIWYGMTEAPVKELPDALPAHTPTTVHCSDPRPSAI